MSRFGPDPLDFFNSVYKDVAPWDIGAPQPAMVALLDKYPPASPTLDLGCGSGDLSIHLARRGYEVTGVDFVEAAIMQAREKAGALPSEVGRLVDFQVADARRPSLLQKQFGTVLDSGFFHLFDMEQCDRLVEEVAGVLLPNGRYYLHEFAVDFQISNMPRGIHADELQARFTEHRGWRILEIQDVGFLSRVAPPVAGICACIERTIA